MGNRLSKIYTRTGDDGTTGLGDGVRIEKDHERVEAYGTVDELNCALGMLLGTAALPGAVVDCLVNVQHELFDIGGELCIPGRKVIEASHVERLERQLDAFNEALPPLKEFVLPGGGAQAAACHFARAVARRAERRVWTLARLESQAPGLPVDREANGCSGVNPETLRYLNRLSDLLFVIARVLVRHVEGAEVMWRHERRRQAP